MKTVLGTVIPKDIKGILYLCRYNYNEKKLNVVNEILCQTAFEALELYANIPNPESQMASGKTHDEFICDLKLLHNKMKDPLWIEKLEECI